MSKGKACYIDIHVGMRLRYLRQQGCGWTQEELAHAVGISFQQIQKYEKGINRISAGRLYKLAQVLKVSVLDFYEGVV